MPCQEFRRDILRIREVPDQAEFTIIVLPALHRFLSVVYIIKEIIVKPICLVETSTLSSMNNGILYALKIFSKI